MASVEQGRLRLSTTARSLLGDDLLEIADDVTVEQLLGHRSGIGDYLDEGGSTPPSTSCRCRCTRSTPRRTTSSPGRPPDGLSRERRLRLQQRRIRRPRPARRTRGWRGLPRTRAPCVLGPAGMTDTAFLRSDELPARAARGYLDRRRAPDQRPAPPRRRRWRRRRLLHHCRPALVLGGASLWANRFLGRGGPDGDPPQRLARGVPSIRVGFHLHATGSAAWLEGYDAGVSFTSLHDPSQEAHLHRDLQLDRRRLADHRAAERPTETSETAATLHRQGVTHERLGRATVRRGFDSASQSFCRSCRVERGSVPHERRRVPWSGRRFGVVRRGSTCGAIGGRPRCCSPRPASFANGPRSRARRDVTPVPPTGHPTSGGVGVPQHVRALTSSAW